jgi:DNA-binding SARP family transcriptional activator/Tfp pilus assembly protein PilF
MTSTLHIHLLGDFLLVLESEPVTTVDWPRMQSMLAYLILHRDAPRSRTHLAFLFWPDSTEEQAHTNLRHLVYRLRRTLPNANSYLHANKQTLHWNPDVPWTLDVADFERAIAEADQAEQDGNLISMRVALEEAVKLYRGDLLLGVYEECLLSERERLRQQFLEALERLIVQMERERRYQEAIRVAQQLLRVDPLHEATYRTLMRLYAGSDDRAAALRTYQTCVTVLERELAMEPGELTQEAYHRLMQKDAPSVPLAASSTPLVGIAPLVGRTLEWSQLQDTWQYTLDGHLGMVVLSGEAGIGKTRLAEELVAWVDRQGVATASAYCYPAEGALAYAPVVTWLRTDIFKPGLATLADTWLTEVARFVPEVKGERPDLPDPGPLLENWQRQRLFEALARAILSARQPLLLLLEDLQWCDHESLEWLHYLLRFDASAHVLVIGTMRPEEVESSHPLESLLKTLRSREQVAEILLGPLSAVETATLAEHIAGQDLDQQEAADFYRETEGNPLFIVETLRMSGGKFKAIERRSRSDPGAVASRTQAVIAARLELLSSLGHELANQAAVIGRAFTFQVLAQASRLDEDSLVQGLDELWQRRIIREQGIDAYDFSHDKLREVAYASLSTAHRRLLHRRVAEALVRVYANELDEVSGQLASHYEQAGIVDHAVTSYQRAAEVARRVYANAEAIAAYQRALALLESAPASEALPEKIAQLHQWLGDVLFLTGQYEEAKLDYERALSHIPRHNLMWLARLHSQFGAIFIEQHRYEEALQAYSTAEVILGPDLAQSTPERWQEWIRIQIRLMDIHYMLGHVDELSELVEKTRPIVEQYGTPVQHADIYQCTMSLYCRRDRYVYKEEYLSYGRSALSAIQETGDDLQIAWVRFELGMGYLLYGDLDAAEEQLQIALAVEERTGNVAKQNLCFTYLATLYRKRGWVKETRDYASHALAIATALKLSPYIAMATANLAWVAWREGKNAEAEQHGKAALELWQSSEMVYPFQWAALWPLIDIMLGQNELSQAVDYVRRLLAPGQQLLPDVLTTVTESALQAWDSGKSENARTSLQQAITLAQEMGYL